MNHSELVDAFGDYKGRTTKLQVSSANTWFDTVTPDQYTRVQLEEATIVCSEHAYRVHHFDNDDFNTVLLVNDTDLVDTTGPVTEDDDARSHQDMSNTEPALTMTMMLMQGAAFSRFRIQTMTSFVLCLVG
jgi:hypothetical protein